jgi:methylenetetrahydrofolate dehydrogenase (NADP+)/methenyltetrahydrofolate cyclohydrolase
MILDGKSLAAELADELKMQAAGKKIKLAVILVGDNPDSAKYVNAKQRRAMQVGVACDIVRLPETITESELLNKIDELNADGGVDGLMIQLPLPRHLNQDNATLAISPKKDVDGLNRAGNFMPATVRGIEKLLEHYLFGEDFDLSGRVAVVVGRSVIVGRPAAQMLLNHNATVIICHSKTKDLESFTKQADILVAAVGKKDFITPAHIKSGAIIIDAGTNGDVAHECYAEASAYTPVPGGVGPMTVISLIENTIRASE